MRLRSAATAAAAFVFACATIPLTSSAGSSHAQGAIAVDCTIKRGGSLTQTPPWAQTRLGFQRAWSATPGQGVSVAVIDSGLEKPSPALSGLKTRVGYNVLDHSTITHDCANHGTGVAAIIAAPFTTDSSFVGVAPDATIVPIKQSDTEVNANGSNTLAAAILKAISLHVKLANLSLTVTTPTAALHAAVQSAARAGLILVCAAGNDGQGNNLPTYPAAYSTQFSNVIAVSATDAHDSAASFSETGNYVDIAAPGLNVEVPSSGGGYVMVSGTSFATPYVTGTVALMLAANPGMTPAQVRSRLEATADPPPASVPDSKYGYGIVNPYLAVTAVREDVAAPSSPAPGPPLPARAAPVPPDRHLQHVALGSAAALLGLAALVVAAASVLRGQRAQRGQSGPPGQHAAS
jgi:membrane-anchored mycosin MYCP